MKAKAGLFWSEIGMMATLDWQPRFSLLYQLMAGLLSIPVSSFSILRKIHTDQRSNLDQSIIIALMAMKFNCDECCCDVDLSLELLSARKRPPLCFSVWPASPRLLRLLLHSMSFVLFTHAIHLIIYSMKKINGHGHNIFVCALHAFNTCPGFIISKLGNYEKHSSTFYL